MLVKKIIWGVVIMSMFLFASCEKKNVETNNQMFGEPWVNSNIFKVYSKIICQALKMIFM